MTPTKEERLWWARFHRVLKDMPETLEVLISAHGQVSAAKRGASSAYFDEHTNVDNVPTLPLPIVRVEGIENNGSSL